MLTLLMPKFSICRSRFYYNDYNIPINTMPFVWIGVNDTTFFKEKISTGGNIELENPIRMAGHAGIDIPYAETEYFRMNARYMDIEPDVSLRPHKKDHPRTVFFKTILLLINGQI